MYLYKLSPYIIAYLVVGPLVKYTLFQILRNLNTLSPFSPMISLCELADSALAGNARKTRLSSAFGNFVTYSLSAPALCPPDVRYQILSKLNLMPSNNPVQ